MKSDNMKYLHGKIEGNFCMTKQKRNLIWKNKGKILYEKIKLVFGIFRMIRTNSLQICNL